MTRGRHPDQGRALAEPVARRRGMAHVIEPGQHTLLDLVITGPGIFCAVTVRRAQHLRAPIPELETEFGSLIGEVRQLPGKEPVSREIWWYNRAGQLRFFRVDATALVELAADGQPLTEKPGNRQRKQKARPAAPSGEASRETAGEVQAGSGT